MMFISFFIQMSNIDIILGILLSIGIVRGFMKGFIWEVASLLSIFVALWVAIHFSAMAAGYLSEVFSLSTKTNQVISFVIVFLLAFVMVRIAGKMLTKALESVSLGLPNRIAGAVFGMFKWSLIVGTSLMYLNRGALELIPKESSDQSLLYAPIMEMNDWIRTHIFQYKDLLPKMDTEPSHIVQS
ncbi:CvpA family protein [uncultured Capnocytophaga sp.]|uniref:CvpA family protein n=1 Tax=uncultured Capnocytophaga sp. TaxID=159273 RepID=UPI00262D7A15|nr:CvpA family protein [uncultured Capnocytophaga sp.]